MAEYPVNFGETSLIAYPLHGNLHMPRVLKAAIRTAILVAALGGGTAALANESAEKVSPPLAKDYPGLCAELVNPFLTDHRYQAIIKQSPIDRDKICACLEKPLRKDQYIGPLFTTSGEHLMALDRERFSTYFATKMTSEMMVCVGVALSYAASQFDPHPLKSE